MYEIVAAIRTMLSAAASRNLMFYNEAELQHELGYWLRTMLPSERSVYFERPAASFYPHARGLAKKEIDLVVADSQNREYVAIELKCPRSGRIPETMYDACKDLQLLEQLIQSGFSGGIFLMHVIDPGFYKTGMQEGIYSYFRAGVPLTGTIPKPTGSKDTIVTLERSYGVEWQPYGASGQYWLQTLTATRS